MPVAFELCLGPEARVADLPTVQCLRRLRVLHVWGHKDGFQHGPMGQRRCADFCDGGCCASKQALRVLHRP